MKERILDLGVGGGGDYLLRNEPGTLQVGMDIRLDKIKILQKNHKREIMPLVATVENELPFQDGIYDRVRIMFPDGALLYGLCYSDISLWPELHRVLKEDGIVEMVVDVPFFGYREVVMNKKRVVQVYDPQVKIRTRCQEFGFSSSVQKLSRRTVKEFGTNFSDQFSRWMWIPFFFSVYKISATKKS